MRNKRIFSAVLSALILLSGTAHTAYAAVPVVKKADTALFSAVSRDEEIAYLGTDGTAVGTDDLHMQEDGIHEEEYNTEDTAQTVYWDAGLDYNEETGILTFNRIPEGEPYSNPNSVYATYVVSCSNPDIDKEYICTIHQTYINAGALADKLSIDLRFLLVRCSIEGFDFSKAHVEVQAGKGYETQPYKSSGSIDVTFGGGKQVNTIDSPVPGLSVIGSDGTKTFRWLAVDNAAGYVATYKYKDDPDAENGYYWGRLGSLKVSADIVRKGDFDVYVWAVDKDGNYSAPGICHSSDLPVWNPQFTYDESTDKLTWKNPDIKVQPDYTTKGWGMYMTYKVKMKFTGGDHNGEITEYPISIYDVDWSTEKRIGVLDPGMNVKAAVTQHIITNKYLNSEDVSFSPDVTVEVQPNTCPDFSGSILTSTFSPQTVPYTITYNGGKKSDDLSTPNVKLTHQLLKQYIADIDKVDGAIGYYYIIKSADEKVTSGYTNDNAFYISESDVNKWGKDSTIAVWAIDKDGNFSDHTELTFEDAVMDQEAAWDPQFAYDKETDRLTFKNPEVPGISPDLDGKGWGMYMYYSLVIKDTDGRFITSSSAMSVYDVDWSTNTRRGILDPEGTVRGDITSKLLLDDGTAVPDKLKVYVRPEGYKDRWYDSSFVSIFEAEEVPFTIEYNGGNKNEALPAPRLTVSSPVSSNNYFYDINWEPVDGAMGYAIRYDYEKTPYYPKSASYTTGKSVSMSAAEVSNYGINTRVTVWAVDKDGNYGEPAKITFAQKSSDTVTGDLDKDGDTDNDDLHLLARHIMNRYTTVPEGYDLDGDGSVTVKDAVLLKKLINEQSA